MNSILDASNYIRGKEGFFDNYAQVTLSVVNPEWQFPWRDFQTEWKNITFKTLKISTFQKTPENPQKNQRNFNCVNV